MTSAPDFPEEFCPFSGVWQNGAHYFPVRVNWENTDAAGIVYHSNYLNYAERARTEGLRLLGVSQTAAIEELGVAFAVARAEIDYFRPGRLDDLLIVETTIARLGGSIMDMEQTIWRQDERLATIMVRVACVTVEGMKATRIPPPLRALMKDLVSA
ncbi:YbgC/FadM family acyl-CoA thioesterase [Phaeovibrio sulfidiphilus]|uniref:YbgC/FadM family acyl-CoA thioesterase n=1 Tax=Phaeovibrio sulfidiphilus TaxID=1220600 RepID=A0A8J7CCV9_9PROT|nr:YbgC/FadM family acyl-CoA thioesterase [Phaeovibrio sulfidiphilus]MBE1236229.1 YbgC/FadM family acyl-CoA thioesterase [Phaeovibrio sulfidiphilus]